MKTLESLVQPAQMVKTSNMWRSEHGGSCSSKWGLQNMPPSAFFTGLLTTAETKVIPANYWVKSKGK